MNYADIKGAIRSIRSKLNSRIHDETRYVPEGITEIDLLGRRLQLLHLMRVMTPLVYLSRKCLYPLSDATDLTSWASPLVTQGTLDDLTNNLRYLPSSNTSYIDDIFHMVFEEDLPGLLVRVIVHSTTTHDQDAIQSLKTIYDLCEAIPEFAQRIVAAGFVPILVECYLTRYTRGGRDTTPNAEFTQYVLMNLSELIIKVETVPPVCMTLGLPSHLINEIDVEDASVTLENLFIMGTTSAREDILRQIDYITRNPTGNPIANIDQRTRLLATIRNILSCRDVSRSCARECVELGVVPLLIRAFQNEGGLRSTHSLHVYQCLYNIVGRQGGWGRKACRRAEVRAILAAPQKMFATPEGDGYGEMLECRRIADIVTELLETDCPLLVNGSPYWND